MSKNPWISIWNRPSATISEIVAENPNRSLWLLAAIYGFSSLMNMFQSAALGSSMSPVLIILLAAIFSPIWGYLAFTVWSAFVHLTGKLFRGQAPYSHVRAAYAWCCVPLAVNVVLWFVMAAIFGRQLFLNFPDEHLLSQGLITLLFVILIIKVVLSVWSLVIYLNALATVQNFSVLRAILNVIVAAILLGIVLGILWTISMYLMGNPSGNSMTTFHFWECGYNLEYLRRVL